MYSKTPENELHKSKEPVNKKKNKAYRSVSNLCGDSPQSDPRHVANSHLNSNRIQRHPL